LDPQFLRNVLSMCAPFCDLHTTLQWRALQKVCRSEQLGIGTCTLKRRACGRFTGERPAQSKPKSESGSQSHIRASICQSSAPLEEDLIVIALGTCSKTLGMTNDFTTCASMRTHHSNKTPVHRCCGTLTLQVITPAAFPRH
jgi:hypothetical protein